MSVTTECPMHRAARLNATNIMNALLNSTGAALHDHNAHMGHDMSGASSSNGGGGGGGHNHGMMGDDDMMYMYFHGGISDTILFDFWRPKSLIIFLLSCFILFISAALYEGLKLLREKLIRNEINRLAQDYDKEQASQKEGLNNNESLLFNNNNNNNTKPIDEATITETKVKIFQNRSRLLSRGHLIQTFLHMVQVTLSYLLMLVFMTYNSWLCLSVVLGAGLGYFFFGYKRMTTIDSNEHCH